jgi:hypothetical protein
MKWIKREHRITQTGIMKGHPSSGLLLLSDSNDIVSILLSHDAVASQHQTTGNVTLQQYFAAQAALCPCMPATSREAVGGILGL